MSASMSLLQLHDLMQHIHLHNSPLTVSRGKSSVKYIDPHIDNRDGKCFSITFRGFGTDVNFNVVNENHHNPKSLYERCLTYVDTGEIT